MRYFAYGSNMDHVQMAQRCPGSVALGPARLANHRLVFVWDSPGWGGGVGHVEPLPGDEVWGVLWEVTTEDEDSLDHYEGVVANVYAKATITVEHDGEPVQAMLYLAANRRLKAPSAHYMKALVRGATKHGLPEEYIAHLRSYLDHADEATRETIQAD
jgi:cation transport regulator ChaC